MGDVPRPSASPEAEEAIQVARDAKAGIRAVLPLTERMRDQMREVGAANHFADLFRDALAQVDR